ncbi:hypothetical protein EmuJ_000534500 [Echinococcus multilocularis]|uniref:Uncharacterized protein n=1 Tax=Echinococcus multilocularis TaxID=6211 RepID=A0A068Y4G5_ECHMU|nr:hypothetical protein EmuJ_000534500 [Echinococcus multilocularis]
MFTFVPANTPTQVQNRTFLHTKAYTQSTLVGDWLRWGAVNRVITGTTVAHFSSLRAQHTCYLSLSRFHCLSAPN